MMLLLLKNVKFEKWKNEFCMSIDYGSKIDLIGSKSFVEVDYE